jgi:outer membrane usher protein
VGLDNALAYGVNLGRTDNGNSASTLVGGNVSYATPVASLSASASMGPRQSQQSASVSGGIVAFPGGVAFAPSVGETVAVVEAKDAAGARLANAAGLRVDPWGHAVVSGLTPFARNQITVDPQGLPLNIQLKSTMQQVAPTAGAVVKVQFETENTGRTVIIEGRRADGEPLPFGADVLDASGVSVGTVAQGGRILARGLKTDRGVLMVVLDASNAQHCRLDYELPADQDGAAPAASMGKGVCSDWAAALDKEPTMALILATELRPQ